MPLPVYERHDRTFAGVTAAVVLDSAHQLAGTIAFSRGRSSGFVRCFLHPHGSEMSTGTAGGGGYDKHTAAAHDAARRLKAATAHSGEARARLEAFRAALAHDGGDDWRRQLEDAGFRVLVAV
jgi:hypothetical protein